MIMLTKVVNNNKPEQRAKSMHIFIFYLFKVCLFLFYFHTCINSKVKDLQVFQGVSRRKLCYFALFIPTFSTNSHHRLLDRSSLQQLPRQYLPLMVDAVAFADFFSRQEYENSLVIVML